MSETTELDRETLASAAGIEAESAAHPAAARAACEDATPRWFKALAEPRLAIPVIVAFGAILFTLNLGGYPLYTKGEPREAVTILDIVNGAGVVLPMRAGVELPSKPLLMHWLGALVSLAMGRVDEWSVRLPSALLAIAGLVVCYGYVRRLFDGASGFLAALVLGSTFQYMQAGTGARVDMTLTFFMEVAFFEFIAIAEGLTKRRTLLYVSIALAVLAKGPVGLALPVLAAIVWMAMEHRWGLVRELALKRGVLIVGVIAGSWYVAASIVGGVPFIEKQLWSENIVRFFGAAHFHEGHVHPFYYLELALLGGFMPWTPMLALVMVRAARDPRRLDARLKYLLVWFGAVLLFYSVARSKRGVYLLALYPALATIVGLYLADAVRRPAVSARTVRMLSILGGWALVAAASAALAGVVLVGEWPGALGAIFRVFDIRDLEFLKTLAAAASARPVFSIVVPAACGALGAVLIIGRSSAERLGLEVAGGMALIACTANMVVVPAIAQTLTLKQFAADALSVVDGHSVAYLGGIDYDLAFYTARNIPIIGLDEAGGVEYLICWRRFYRSLRRDRRAQYKVVITSHPTNLDDTGRMLLLRRVEPSSREVEV
jgi:4-amino-4-deoxy-L-arabinose transferase-like glycosyltransferase